MPFALLVIGLLLIVSGARGTYPQLKELLIKDFTGPHNFLQWIVAIGAVGILGYVPSLEKFSRVFLALVIISIFLAEKGFFNKFSEALNNVAAGGGANANGSAPLTGVDRAISQAGNDSLGGDPMGRFVSSILGKN